MFFYAQDTGPVVDWKLSGYTKSGSLSITGETLATGFWFKPDGTKLYVVGGTQDRIRSWELTTAWDITTATNLYAMTTTLKDTSGVALTLPSGLSLSGDGLYAFVTDSTANGLYRYNLTSAWDLSTLNVTASQQNTSIYSGALTPQSIWVRSDGLMFATVNSGVTNGWKTYTTAVANDITTLTETSNIGAGNGPVGGVFVNDGKRWLSLRQTTDTLEMSKELSTPYVLTGWSLDNSISVNPQDTTPQDIYMKNDGTRFYYLGSAGDTIHQFIL